MWEGLGAEEAMLIFFRACTVAAIFPWKSVVTCLGEKTGARSCPGPRILGIALRTVPSPLFSSLAREKQGLLSYCTVRQRQPYPLFDQQGNRSHFPTFMELN